MTLFYSPLLYNVCISTHILTKRMTVKFLECYIKSHYFNSHPHEEDDMIPYVRFYLHHNFNSHPHEEDDNYIPLLFHFLKHFNSHPHEEDDNGLYTAVNIPIISTHILTKRMTCHIVIPPN